VLTEEKQEVGAEVGAQDSLGSCWEEPLEWHEDHREQHQRQQRGLERREEHARTLRRFGN